jgi:hypothetical protein
VVHAVPVQGPSWHDFGTSSLELQQQQQQQQQVQHLPLVLHAQSVPLPQHHGVFSLHEIAGTDSELFGNTMTQMHNDYRRLQNAMEDMHVSIEKLSSQLAELSQHNPAQSLAGDNAAAASREVAALAQQLRQQQTVLQRQRWEAADATASLTGLLEHAGMTDDHLAGLSTDANWQQSQSPGPLDVHQRRGATEHEAKGFSKPAHGGLQELMQDAGASPRHTMQSAEGATEHEAKGYSKPAHGELQELTQDAGASPRHTMQSAEDDGIDWGGMVTVRAPADMPPEQISKALADAAMISTDSIVAIERAHVPVAAQGNSRAAAGSKKAGGRSSLAGDRHDGRKGTGSTHRQQQMELYTVRLRSPELANKIAGSHTTRMALLLKHSPIKLEKADRGEARRTQKNVATASLDWLAEANPLKGFTEATSKGLAEATSKVAAAVMEANPLKGLAEATSKKATSVLEANPLKSLTEATSKLAAAATTAVAEANPLKGLAEATSNVLSDPLKRLAEATATAAAVVADSAVA